MNASRLCLLLGLAACAGCIPTASSSGDGPKAVGAPPAAKAGDGPATVPAPAVAKADKARPKNKAAAPSDPDGSEPAPAKETDVPTLIAQLKDADADTRSGAATDLQALGPREGGRAGPDRRPQG